VEHRGYRISSDRFQIRTTSPRYAEWLDYGLAGYQVRGAAPSRYSIIVEDGKNDRRLGQRLHILYRGATQVLRSLSVQTLSRMLLGELESILFPRQTDAIYVKSARLSAHGRTALLPSSFLTWIGGLGRRVERAGIQLPDSKMIAVDRSSSQVVPVAARLKVPADAIDRLEQLFPSDGPAERSTLDRQVGVDVVYTVVSSDHPPVSPASRAFTLQQLAGSLVNTRLMGKATLRTLAELVEAAQCYQLAFGDPRSMLHAIAETMASG
jgi:hypothetical protein